MLAKKQAESGLVGLSLLLPFEIFSVQLVSAHAVDQIDQ
jgi:hypothetical protein